jgi:hypothetical protein
MQLELFDSLGYGATTPATRPSRYRLRLQQVLGKAYALGVLRTERRHLEEPVPRAFSSAAVVPQNDLKLLDAISPKTWVDNDPVSITTKRAAGQARGEAVN